MIRIAFVLLFLAACSPPRAEPARVIEDPIADDIWIIDVESCRAWPATVVRNADTNVRVGCDEILQFRRQHVPVDGPGEIRK